MTNTGDKILKVVNKTRKTVRFNSVLAFYPGEPLRVTERLIKSYPAISILLKRGEFELLGEESSAPAEKAAAQAVQTEQAAETQTVGKEPAPKKRAKRGPKMAKQNEQPAQTEQAADKLI